MRQVFGVRHCIYIPGPKDLNDGPDTLNVLQPNGGYQSYWIFSALGKSGPSRVVLWSQVCLQ